jgi:hypothetical protein
MRAAPWFALSAILLATPAAAQGVWDELLKLQNPAAPLPPSQSPPKAASINDIFSPGELRLPLRRGSDVPGPFREAALATKCPLENISAADPGELVRIPHRSGNLRRQRVLAILPCSRGIALLHGVYLLDPQGDRAEALVLPAITADGRIVATRLPGYMEWDPATETLTAILGSDLIPHNSFRHHYRLHAGWQSPFALTRIEKAASRGMSPQLGWQRIWEAPDWGVVDEKGPDLFSPDK